MLDFTNFESQIKDLPEAQRHAALETKRIEIDFYIRATQIKSEEKRDFWSKVAVFVPLIVAIIGAIVGFFQWQGTLKAQAEQKVLEARLQLTQRALEIIMQGPTTGDVVGKARFIAEVFPGILPDYVKYPSEEKLAMPKLDQENRQALFKELAAKLNASQSLALYKVLFSGDQWVKELELPKE